MKEDKEINLNEIIKKQMRNIGIILIGAGILSIYVGIGNILKENIEGVLNIFIGIFVIYLVVKDRRKTKKEADKK